MPWDGSDTSDSTWFFEDSASEFELPHHVTPWTIDLLIERRSTLMFSISRLISQYHDLSRSLSHILSVQEELRRSLIERLSSNLGFVEAVNSNSDSNAEVSGLWSDLDSDFQTAFEEGSAARLFCDSGRRLRLNQKCQTGISLMGETFWSWKSPELEDGRKIGKVSKGRREEFESSVILTDAG
jgi:hypothetical protein